MGTVDTDNGRRNHWGTRVFSSSRVQVLLGSKHWVGPGRGGDMRMECGQRSPMGVANGAVVRRGHTGTVGTVSTVGTAERCSVATVVHFFPDNVHRIATSANVCVAMGSAVFVPIHTHGMKVAKSFSGCPCIVWRGPWHGRQPSYHQSFGSCCGQGVHEFQTTGAVCCFHDVPI